MLRELPPTAGLPPRLSDLFGTSTPGALDQALGAFLHTGPPQIECSGTACLVIAFEHLKLASARRSIIVPAYTCPLVVRAAARAGLKVLACDLAPGTFDLDEAHLAQLAGPDILCAIATHYGGFLTDVARLRAILPPGIAIIEDAAQAFGARQNNLATGLAGDIGFYSFALGKGFTLYEGGALVACDAATRAGLLQASQKLVLRQPGREFYRCLEYAMFHGLYNPLGLRLVYGTSKNFWLRRKDEIRAVGDYFDDDIVLHQVSDWRTSVAARAFCRFPAHLAATRSARHRLLQALAQIDGLNLHAPRTGDEPTGIFAFVTLPSAAQCSAALRHLWRSPLGVSKLFAHALGDYAYLAPLLVATSTPHARDLAARTLTITTSPSLRDADIAKIVSGIAQGMAHRA